MSVPHLLPLPLPASVPPLLTDRTVFAAFSGGSDSTALVLALAACRTTVPFTLEAVHFTHGIRSAERGRAEREFCEKICGERKIPLRTIELHVPDHRESGEGLEEAARRIRLEAWNRLTTETPGAVVALGHHADDRAENLMIRLLRGSNVSALTSLRVETTVDGVCLVRPLLAYTKEELRAYLRRNGVETWMEDASNADETYLRNYLRNTVLPELYRRFPPSRSGLTAAAAALEDDARFLDAATERAATEFHPDRTADWRMQPPAIRTRLMRRWLSTETGADHIPDRHLLARFTDALERTKESGEAVLIPLRDVPGHRLSVHKERVLFLGPDTPAPVREEMVWDWRTTPSIGWNGRIFTAELRNADSLPDRNVGPDTALFDADRLPETPLLLTGRRDGDRMCPFGAGTPVKVKKLLAGTGIAAPVLVRTPGDGTVIWLPGIRQSAFAACTADTKRILRLTVRG